MLDSLIPFNKPFIIGSELDYIKEAVVAGKLAGDGLFTRRCHAWMENKFSARKALLTTSCTAALEMAAILADLKEGDEVIMPSFTFVSTANAFLRTGAKIRFVDVRHDTLNIDETKIEAVVNDRTRVIVPVHYAGIGCEMDSILDLARKYNLLVVEDAAQAVNSTYKGRYLGTLGHFGTFSFHETKNFISGEGGALLVNDLGFAERAEIIREKGTNRSKFFRGEVDKYTWVDQGSSYLPSELIAAFLFAQLEKADEISSRRIEIFNTYKTLLTPLESRGLIRLPACPEECSISGHIFYLITKGGLQQRADLIQFLKDLNIHATFHYVPLHSSEMGLKMGYRKGDLPVTEELSESIVRLPCFFELSERDQYRVVKALFAFYRVDLDLDLSSIASNIKKDSYLDCESIS